MKSKQHLYNFFLGAICLGVVFSSSASVNAQIQMTETTQTSESGAGSAATPTPTSNNASLEAQIAALLAQVAALQNQLSGSGSGSSVTPANPDPRPTAPVPENDQIKARLAIREANTLNRELRSLILGMDDRTAAVEPRAAYSQALKLVSSARRDYIAKRYAEAYTKAVEAQGIAQKAIDKFNQLPAPIQCPMTGVICANGAAPTVDAKGCYTVCPVTPIMCTMDAKICPDGSSVGRVGPKCEFAACPTPSTGGGGGGGGGGIGPKYNLQ